MVCLGTIAEVQADSSRLAAGHDHAVVINECGDKAWAWGVNNYGQSGANSDATAGEVTNTTSTPPMAWSVDRPVRVSASSSALLDGVTCVAASRYNTLAVSADGKALAWGRGDHGALGAGAATGPAYSLYPVVVQKETGGDLTQVVSVSTGTDFSLALLGNGEVWSWGYNINGKLLGRTSATFANSAGPVRTVSGAVLSGVKQIASGIIHSIALTNDGHVYVWGSNASSQLSGGVGSGGATRATDITSQIPSSSPVVAIGAGHEESFAILQNGSVYAWGRNHAGQLGISNPSGSTSPVATPSLVVLPSGATVTEIAGGAGHTLALLQDGHILGWGDNDGGEVGIGQYTTAPVTTPQYVKDSTGAQVANATAIACGERFSSATTADGKLLTWGVDDNSSLGNGTSSQSSPSAAAISLGQGEDLLCETVVQADALIAAGDLHSIVTRLDATAAWSWGYNGFGRLGINVTDSESYDSEVPVRTSASAAVTGVTAVAAGSQHSYVVVDGKVIGVGHNNYGQLGAGDFNDADDVDVNRHVVREDGPVLDQVSSVVSGAYFGLALRNGQVWSWGRNYAHELGRGVNSTIGNFLNTAGLVKTGANTTLENVTAIAAGSYHALALTASGDLYVWGTNQYGQLTDAVSTSYQNSETPYAVWIRGGVARIGAGYDCSYAVTTDGQLLAWGRNHYSQLGLGTAHESDFVVATPSVVTLPSTPVAIDGGEDHTVAILADGTVYAWGHNESYQVGSNNTTATYFSTPQQVLEDRSLAGDGTDLVALTGVAAISCGQDFTLAVKSDGRLLNWGSDGSQALGNGSGVVHQAAARSHGLPDLIP